MRNKVVLVGVGWMRHKRLSERWMKPDFYTRMVYRLALSKDYYHAVRDNYAESKLRELGFKVLNTGCPSLWSLSKEHYQVIPKKKGRFVVTTLTSYRRNLEADRTMLNILRRHYEKIFLWPQQPDDWFYAQEVLRGEANFVEILPPSLEAYDEILSSNESIDYVGTRLHAYIRALQHRRRAINIGVDDRALEMAKDFNLIVIPRGEWTLLEDLIQQPFETRIQIPEENISFFKQQFRTCL